MALNKFWSHWWGKLLVLGALLALGLGGYFGYSVYEASHTAQEAKLSEQAQLNKKLNPKKLVTQPDPNGQYSYGNDNSGIPTAKQLKTFQQSKGTLSQIGYAGTNKQPGLKAPISGSPIFVGASDKVLATGTGTLSANFKLGEGNNQLARHSFGGTPTTGDYVLGFSPLQKIDVSKQPKFYETDGTKIYTYRLTKRQVIDVKSNPKAYQNAVYGDTATKVTLVTCDEPIYGTINRHPDKRIVVSGALVDTQAFKDAPTSVKAIFPQVA
ncbi:class A sortase [Weissella viridescens]|uniref:Class A sortase n=1 Tax=Weissella viridescens TaxID=1629 RepID=A0A3P2RDB1_WEIVI|nr:class A sortase [Weissella viridescens]RRG17345.1 class A sortase [Weissella viridescens]